MEKKLYVKYSIGIFFKKNNVESTHIPPYLYSKFTRKISEKCVIDIFLPILDKIYVGSSMYS